MTDGELDNLRLQYARSSLLGFILYMMPTYSVQWFHKHICKKLDELLYGDIKKLMLFVPPQHGKSLIVSQFLPAYAFGRDPNLRINTASYSADLANSFNRKVQGVIDTDNYQKIFPHTKLSGMGAGQAKRTDDKFEIVNAQGVYKSVGVQGSLTGNPTDIGVIDDPVKDRAEANSDTYRKRVYEWYQDVFMTRLHNKSKQLLIMTRWHEDDLAGRILASDKDWEVLSFAGICEVKDQSGIDPRNIGEALWEERHSLERLTKIKNESDRTFTSLYQQRPAPLEGGLFKRNWWKQYDKVDTVNKLVMSIDCAFGGGDNSDYVSIVVLGKQGANCFILDVDNRRLNFPQTIEAVRSMRKKWQGVQQVYIEAKANGQAVIDTLKNEIVGIIPINPRESKIARAHAVSHIVEGGNCFLPVDAPWLKLFLRQLSNFPNDANDDIVDAFTQALSQLYLIGTSEFLKVRI